MYFEPMMFTLLVRLLTTDLHVAFINLMGNCENAQLPMIKIEMILYIYLKCINVPIYKF